MSNRRITDEQFSTNSTIDGSRISKAVSEAVEYNNNLPIEAVCRSRAVSCICLGAYPRAVNAAAGALTYSAPWLWYSWADASSNKYYRAKGIQAATSTSGSLRTDDGGLWTVSTLFERPVIIDTVCVHIDHIDQSFPIKLSTTPYTNGPSLLQLLIDTDDVTAPEDRTLNAKELHYFNFDPRVYQTPQLNDNTAPTNDMLPLYPADAKSSANAEGTFVLEKSDLNIPIHQFARVNFRLAFANELGTSANFSWKSSGAPFTMHPGQPTFVIFFREQLRG